MDLAVAGTELPTYQNAPTDATRLAAILSGKRGPVHYDYELWRSNNEGELLEKLPAVRSATINLQNARDWAWELTLPIGEAARVDVIEDFVKVLVKVWDPAITDWQSFAMGLYYFAAPSGTDNPLFTDYELTGKSLEAILLDSTYYQGFRVGAGQGVLSAVKAILTGYGFDASRIDFPPTSADKILPYDFFADPFQDVESVRPLRVINALLAAGGFYSLFTDKEGVFRTRDIEDGPLTEFDAHYGSIAGSDQMITGEVPFEVDDENFANSVVAYSGDANQQFLVARAENHDPNSRVSVEALKAAGRGDGRVQKDPIEVQLVATSAELLKFAKAALREASGMNVKRTIPTRLDPRRDARETYKLSIYREDGTEVATGLWPVDDWQAELTPDANTMTHNVHVSVNL